MKIYIETLGCVKNFEDSETAAGILENAGHAITTDIFEADVIMVNTCGFIGDAKKESISRIFEMADYEKPLLVSGCLSERYKKELFKEMPEVDIFIGVNDYPNLPKILEGFSDEEGKARKLAKREKYFSGETLLYEEIPFRKTMGAPYSASLKIAEGCDNRCTYCVIPSIRGGYRSRKIEDIVAEGRKLTTGGAKEIILIAQDVTGYGMDIYGEYALPKLVKALCEIDELNWLRLMYCYEDRITDELIKTMTENEKVCHYIDIPIQHSSDKILKAMNRRSTSLSIKNTIERLRNAMPDINIRTTLITGFPGESKEDFSELSDFVASMKFERLGVFAYSKEEGTPAAKMKNQVRQETKEKRRDSLMRMQLDISLKSNEKKIGSILEVLVEEIEIEEENSEKYGEKPEKFSNITYVGRSRYDAPEIDNSVIFTADREIKIGDIVKVLITDAFDYDLVGKCETKGCTK